jgi:hypothetical protein
MIPVPIHNRIVVDAAGVDTDAGSVGHNGN